MITIKQLEKEWGAPVEEWTGNCYGLACAAAKLIEDAVPLYGHYLGEVAPGTFFERTALGFVQHGWVLLPDGQILDPTRWVFEGVEPYLYVGPNDVYDEGGNQLRTSMLGGPPEFDPESQKFDVMAHLSPDAWLFAAERLGLDRYVPWTFEEMGCDFGHVTNTQLAWLANQDPRTMRGHAREIFATLRRLGFKAFVPIDNWQMVERTPM